MAIDTRDFVLGFDSLWNSGNREGILAVVDDQSLVEIAPPLPPPAQTRYAGSVEIGRFLDTFLPGFHVDSSDFSAEGDALVWQSDVRNDVFRAMGADPARGTSRAKLGPGGKLRYFSFTLDQATVERLSGDSLPD